MIDTHTHLNFLVYKETWRQVVDEAINSGVEKIIVVGTDIESSKRAVQLSQEHPALYAVVGIHPHHAKSVINKTTNDKESMLEMIDNDMEAIESLANNSRVVAIGETGLDEHQYKSKRYQTDYTEKETIMLEIAQQELFKRHINLSLRKKLPLVMHSRESGSKVLEMLMELTTGSEIPKGVFHCFDGSIKYLEKILQAGFYVSFTGNITFVDDRSQVASRVPIDKLLLETDSPYMTPVPFRNKPNTPSLVKYVAKHHAKTRGLSLDELIALTTRNANNLFKFDR